MASSTHIGIPGYHSPEKVSAALDAQRTLLDENGPVHAGEIVEHSTAFQAVKKLIQETFFTDEDANGELTAHFITTQLAACFALPENAQRMLAPKNTPLIGPGLRDGRSIIPLPEGKAPVSLDVTGRKIERTQGIAHAPVVARIHDTRGEILGAFSAFRQGGRPSAGLVTRQDTEFIHFTRELPAILKDVLEKNGQYGSNRKLIEARIKKLDTNIQEIIALAGTAIMMEGLKKRDPLESANKQSGTNPTPIKFSRRFSSPNVTLKEKPLTLQAGDPLILKKGEFAIVQTGGELVVKDGNGRTLGTIERGAYGERNAITEENDDSIIISNVTAVASKLTKVQIINLKRNEEGEVRKPTEVFELLLGLYSSYAKKMDERNKMNAAAIDRTESTDRIAWNSETFRQLANARPIDEGPSNSIETATEEAEREAKEAEANIPTGWAALVQSVSSRLRAVAGL